MLAYHYAMYAADDDDPAACGISDEMHAVMQGWRSTWQAGTAAEERICWRAALWPLLRSRRSGSIQGCRYAFLLGLVQGLERLDSALQLSQGCRTHHQEGDILTAAQECLSRVILTYRDIFLPWHMS